MEGSNDSGKTSLLRILCGFRDADDGEIHWCGQTINDSSYLADLAYVGHADGNKKELTVLENLRFALALSLPGHYSIEQALDKVQLSGFDDNSVYTLSAGQKCEPLQLGATENKLDNFDMSSNCSFAPIWR